MLCFARIIWNPLLAADDSHKRLGWFAQLCEIDLRESSGKRFLNRSYPGTPFRCRESRPYHEEPRLKTSFYPFLPALAALFLHCSLMVTLTSLPALSLQHTEAELHSGRRRRKQKHKVF